MRSLSDPFPRIILHLDMDAFFASVEQMDHPEWRGKPVIIGGETRGVVSTASYEARRFGVHSAMPMTTARRLCPQAIFVRGNRRRYVEISGRIMAALQDFSPLVGCTSLEDLNIGLTYPSVEPLMQMTWLKNLWMVDRGGAYQLSQALPDTKIVASADVTVGAGWRNLPNYYKMRDMLGMEYMRG